MGIMFVVSWRALAVSMRLKCEFNAHVQSEGITYQLVEVMLPFEEPPDQLAMRRARSPWKTQQLYISRSD